MIPLHSVLPELAQREVRCLHLGPVPGVVPTSVLKAGECAYVAERFVLDDAYHRRLRRHYRLFREELSRQKRP